MSGKVRVLFSNPVGSSTDVTLTSMSPAIATIASKVTVPAGSLSADVPYTAVAPGTVLFQGTAGTATVSSSSQVVSTLVVNSGGALTLEVGAHGLFSQGVNIAVPDPVQLSLASSQASIATVDATITIPEFASNGVGQVTAVSPGASIISATVNGLMASQTVTVVDKAQIVSAYATSLLEAGGHGYAQVSLNAQVAAATQLTITGDPSVVTFGGGYTIAAGSNYAYVPITAAGAGSTNLTFALNGSTSTVPVTVLSKAQLEQLYLSNTPTVGAATQLTASMDVQCANQHDITLTSSNPAVVAVPATMTVFAGQSSSTLSITPLTGGDAIITASYNGISRQVDVHVGSSSGGYTINLYGQQRLIVGTIGQLSIQTGVSTAETVMLTSSDPTVISVPSAIIVNNSETAPLNVLKVGTVTITASANGAVASYQITVAASPTINYFGPTFQLGLNSSTNAQLDLDAAAPLGTTISFTTSNGAVAPAPGPVTLSQGQTYIPVAIQSGQTSGTAIITATIGSTSSSAVVYVGGSSTGGGGTFQGVYENGGINTLEIGAVAPLYAYFSPPPPSGDSGTITFGTPGILSTPNTTLGIGAQSYEAYFAVTGVVAGTSDVNVTFSGVQQTATLNVVSAPTYSLQVPSPIKVGSTVSARINSNAMVAANKTFVLSSTAPGVANVVLQAATIGPGTTYYATFGVKGMAAGNATISATINGTPYTANVVVQ